MVNLVKPEGHLISKINQVCTDPLAAWVLPPSAKHGYTQEIRNTISHVISELSFCGCETVEIGVGRIEACYWVDYKKPRVKGFKIPKSHLKTPYTTYALGCIGANNVPQLIAIFIENLRNMCDGKIVYIRRPIYLELDEILSDQLIPPSQHRYNITCRLAICNKEE